MSDEPVIVYESRDPVHAEIIASVLRSEGLHATLLGRHGDVMLFGAGAFPVQRISVLESEVDRATELIDAFDEEREHAVELADPEAADAPELEVVPPSPPVPEPPIGRSLPYLLLIAAGLVLAIYVLSKMS